MARVHNLLGAMCCYYGKNIQIRRRVNRHLTWVLAVKRKPIHPWWNDACANAIKLRETLRQRYMCNKTSGNETLWKNGRNKVHTFTKLTKRL